MYTALCTNGSSRLLINGGWAKIALENVNTCFRVASQVGKIILFCCCFTAFTCYCSNKTFSFLDTLVFRPAFTNNPLSFCGVFSVHLTLSLFYFSGGVHNFFFYFKCSTLDFLLSRLLLFKRCFFPFLPFLSFPFLSII